MKVKWREHEMIFVTIIAAITFSGYVWGVHNTALEQYATPFINNHVPFNLYKNILLPNIGMGLLIYISYLIINLYTIPRLLFPKKIQGGTSKIGVSFSKISLQGMAKKILLEYTWLLIQLFLIIFILGTCYNIAIYYLHQWQFSYSGFAIFFNKDKLSSQLGISQGYVIVSSFTGLYAIYDVVREVAINFIERPEGRRSLRILACNQVTLLTIEYFLIPFFLITFHFISSYNSFISYFLIVPSLLLMFMLNLYWLLPFKKQRAFTNPAVLIRLLLMAFVCSILFLFFMHDMYLFGLLFSMAIQLFIITPISWLVYQNKKDKILQLQGAEKALAKSKTDLQFLRSQINPHFLFNILNTLYGTALQENAERTASGIQKLGDMMRFMLHENHLEFIQMSKEIEYLRNYIALQKLRTQSSSEIIIEENISDQNCNHKIAPMLLIPLVENAFKHGISLKEKSWIQINLECNEKNILFEVRNSMHPQKDNDPEEEKSGIGFKNVLERLKLIYGGKFQISVNGDGIEFFVQLSIQP